MMVAVKRVVLDVLKPHSPDIHALARTVAEQGAGWRVRITVDEVDEKTESVVVTVEGDDVVLDRVVEAIGSLGGSVHSIDEVEVDGSGA
jgi:hypothetical protein